MHAVEQETFTWPHFCYLLKDFLIQQASDECIRSLSFSLPGTLSISFKFCWNHHHPWVMWGCLCHLFIETNFLIYKLGFRRTKISFRSCLNFASFLQCCGTNSITSGICMQGFCWSLLVRGFTKLFFFFAGGGGLQFVARGFWSSKYLWEIRKVPNIKESLAHIYSIRTECLLCAGHWTWCRRESAAWKQAWVLPSGS